MSRRRDGEDIVQAHRDVGDDDDPHALPERGPVARRASPPPRSGERAGRRSRGGAGPRSVAGIGIWSSAVTMPTNRRRSTTAPTVPQIWPSRRIRLGRARTASAMTTALSPESRRFRKLISSSRPQNCGSGRMSIRVGRPLGYVSWRAPAPNDRPRTRRQYGVMTGSAKKKSATALMTPEIGRVNRIASEPCDMIRLWRRAFSAQITQHEGKHERSERIVELLEDIADDTEGQHIPHVDHGAVHGVGADRADGHDERRQDREGNAQDPREQRHAGEHHQDADDIARVHARDQSRHELGLLLEQHRAGCKPQMMSPPSITAAVGEPGIPSVIMGKSDAPRQRARPSSAPPRPRSRPCRIAPDVSRSAWQRRSS